MNDLGGSEVAGKLYRVIYLMIRQTRIQIKTVFGRTDIIEAGETVRQGSVIDLTSLTDVIPNIF